MKTESLLLAASRSEEGLLGLAEAVRPGGCGEAARGGGHREDVFEECRFVSFSPDRVRCEIGGVCFEEDAIVRQAGEDVADRRRLFECEDAREGEMKSQIEELDRLIVSAGETVNDAPDGSGMWTQERHHIRDGAGLAVFIPHVQTGRQVSLDGQIEKEGQGLPLFVRRAEFIKVVESDFADADDGRQRRQPFKGRPLIFREGLGLVRVNSDAGQDGRELPGDFDHAFGG